jgi:hypothetical protein
VRYFPAFTIDVVEDKLKTDGKTVTEAIQILLKSGFTPAKGKCSGPVVSGYQTCAFQFVKFTGQGDTEHVYTFRVAFYKKYETGVTTVVAGNVVGTYSID